jgi:hypothetical protein
MNEKELLKMCYDVLITVDNSRPLIKVLDEYFKTEKNTENLTKEFEQKGIEKVFDLFWNLYPKKIGKKQCIEYWKRGGISVSLFDKIISALTKQIEYKKDMDDKNEWHPEFPHPIRWLKNCRWEDEISLKPEGNFTQVYQKPKYNSRNER